MTAFVVTVPETTTFTANGMQFDHGRNSGPNPPVSGTKMYDPADHANWIIIGRTETDSGSWVGSNAVGWFEITSSSGTIAASTQLSDITGAIVYANASTGSIVSHNFSVTLALVMTESPAISPMHWTLNPIKATLFPVPVPPIANIFIKPPLTDQFLTALAASQKMIDKMASATFSYETIKMLLGTDTFFRHVQIDIPDYLGTSNTVFVGFFPSAQATVVITGGIQYETYTAYDYAWYLTMQYIPFSLLTFLTPDDQLTQTTYKLWYFKNHAIDPQGFLIGDVVVGSTSGDSGIVTADTIGGDDGGMTYRILTLMNPTGIFQTGEDLTVGNVLYGNADGYAFDVTGLLSVITPEVYISNLLGGTNWPNITGINPYRLIPLPNGWTDSSNPVAIEFDFTPQTTKIQAIEKICKYCHYVFMVKTVVIGGMATPCAYFIPETNIDLQSPMGLDLPSTLSPLVFTNGDPAIISPITIERKGEERYNKITVKCQSLNGATWYQSIQQTDGVLNGDEPPVEYFEINPDIANQTDCDARCLDLWNYYQNQILTYTVTFLQRSDLQLMQRIYLTGFTELVDANNPTNLYRIVGIKYDYSGAGTVNDQICTIIPDYQFQFYLNLNRVFTDEITEIQNVIKSELAKLGQNEVATATAVTDGIVTGITEQGNTKLSRDAS